ncbi:MAG: heavy metal-binding domain-containing protein, partial [Ferruginibacter sp.]
MEKLKKIVILVLGLLLYSFVFAQQVTYTCPMHPEIHATKPGNCPKCGMKLVKEKAKAVSKPVIKTPVTEKPLTKTQPITYTCPMHPEIHANKPGNCPKCGMPLVKEKTKPVVKPVIKTPVTEKPLTKTQPITYTCPMHPEIHANKPGNCP